MRRDALPFYRVMAYATGVCLLALCAAMIIRYGPADNPTLSRVVAPIHGWLYVVYLVATGLIVYQRRWNAKWAILIALAGTVPFASFAAERFVVRKASRLSGFADTVAARSDGRADSRHPEDSTSGSEDPPLGPV